MRILGFFFGQQDAARTVLNELCALPSLADVAIDTAPIVADEEHGTLVALSLESEQQPEVERLVARHGGRVVVDVPSDWL